MSPDSARFEQVVSLPPDLFHTRPVSSVSLVSTESSFTLTTTTTICFLMIQNPSRRPAYATLFLV